jgi:hypothetical protein
VPRRLDPLIALLLGAASAALLLLVPFVGDRQWDGLMTASVLARGGAAREWLFFAHPLVIPLTVPFSWITRDPLGAAALREAMFGGVVVALAYLGARAAAGRAAGIIAAVTLILAASRWRLASSGEEKEIALAFGGAFLFLYADHRGAWDLGLARWRRVRPAARRIALAALLAVAIAVHLVNGVLVFVVMADVLLDRSRRKTAREAGAIVGLALAAVGLFFLCVAIGPGGARSPGGVVRHFLEYHLSGEFVSVPRRVGARFVDAYLGGREWLVGPRPAAVPIVEMLAALAVVGAIVARALRNGGRGAALLFVWIALLSAHFYFYEPWDPEAWGPAGLAWCTLGAIGLAAPSQGGDARLARRWRLVSRIVAGAALAGMAVNVAWFAIQDRRDAAPAAFLADGRAPSAAPLADLARHVDRRLPEGAILLVDDRLVASYFHAYTRREPIVVEYLDLTREQLVKEQRLSTLSLRFYAPRMTREEIVAAARGGTPVYYLTVAEGGMDEVETLYWDGLRIGRVGL